MKIIFLAMFLAVNAFGAWMDGCGKDYSGGGTIINSPIDPDAAKAAAIFKRTCVSCHNPNNLSGGVDIMDVDHMWDVSKVLQGGSDSKLFKSLNRPTGWMPLGGPILSVDDKNDILKWIGDGSKKPLPLVDPDPPVGLPTIYYDDLVFCIAQDIALVNKVDRPFTRWLTLENLSNNKKEVEFRRLQEAVIKGLNSISNQSPLKFEGLTKGYKHNGRRAKPGIVDQYGIVLRYDVRDIGIDDPAFYDDQVLVQSQYPYALDRDGFELGEEVEFAEEFIAAETESDLAFIRADHFIHDTFGGVFDLKAGLIYYNFLDNVNLSADKKDDLLALLGVDQARQFGDEEAKRSGLRLSNVANFNRVIDTFLVDVGFPFQFTGQLWTSYDFDNDNLATSNIFANPFGPAGEDLFKGELVTVKEFVHQAEEWIYTNGANGTSLYSIYNGAGIRQNVVPLNVAQDPLNVGVNADYGVVSPNNNAGEIGIQNCFACHSQGMIPYNDVLTDFLLYTPAGFTSEEVLFAQDNFFEQAALTKSLFDYVKIFQTAQTVMGVSNQVAQNTEQLFNSSRYYQGLVDVCELSAELFLDCDEGKKRLLRDPGLAIALGYGVDGSGYSTRNTIEAEFGRIAESFFVGKQIIFVGGQAPKCVLKANKKVVFQGDVVKFLIEVIGKAGLVKINGKKVKNNINLRLNKLGLNRILGFVENQFGSNTCVAKVLVKKKPLVIAPQCKIKSDKNIYSLNDYARVQATYSNKPTKITIQGLSTPSGKANVLLSNSGRFRLWGFVENSAGHDTCDKWVHVKKKFVPPPCTLQISNHTNYGAKFDLRDRNTGERLFKKLKTLRANRRFKVKLDNEFDLLSQLFAPVGGYYYNKIWSLESCKSYKIVIRNGRQVVIKDKN